MERQRSNRAGERRSRRARSDRKQVVIPEVLSARPRGAPRPADPVAEPSSAPVDQPTEARTVSEGTSAEPQARRAARIVVVARPDDDARVRERARLLDRLLRSDGRGSISRAADAYLNAGFDFPREQAVHLQLLEHWDESLARATIEVLREILVGEAPLKRPIFEQRLRRLEDMAEEESTRHAASELRRALRG